MSKDHATVIADTIIAQAVKITELEETVLRLTKENVRLDGQNNHHITMRVQQESIIRTLQARQA